MPKSISIEISKEDLQKQIDLQEDQGGNLLFSINKDETKINIAFDEEEVIALRNYFKRNKLFERLILELPISIKLDEIVDNQENIEKIKTLKISIRESYKPSTSHMEYY